MMYSTIVDESWPQKFQHWRKVLSTVCWWQCVIILRNVDKALIRNYVLMRILSDSCWKWLMMDLTTIDKSAAQISALKYLLRFAGDGWQIQWLSTIIIDEILFWIKVFFTMCWLWMITSLTIVDKSAAQKFQNWSTSTICRWWYRWKIQRLSTIIIAAILYWRKTFYDLLEMNDGEFNDCR